jgi:hypothetical protein
LREEIRLLDIELNEFQAKYPSYLAMTPREREYEESLTDLIQDLEDEIQKLKQI